jgi:hypothetical protein
MYFRSIEIVKLNVKRLGEREVGQAVKLDQGHLNPSFFQRGKIRLGYTAVSDQMMHP